MLPHKLPDFVSITISDDEFEITDLCSLSIEPTEDATVTIKRLESGAFAIHFMKPLPYFGTSMSHLIVLPRGTLNLLQDWIETVLAEGED